MYLYFRRGTWYHLFCSIFTLLWLGRYSQPSVTVIDVGSERQSCGGCSLYPAMVIGIRASDPRGLNKGRGSKFRLGSRHRQEVLEEGPIEYERWYPSRYYKSLQLFLFYDDGFAIKSPANFGMPLNKEIQPNQPVLDIRGVRNIPSLPLSQSGQVYRLGSQHHRLKAYQPPWGI